MRFIFLLLLLVSSMAFGQRVQTFDADCIRIKDGACVDKDELGSLDGVSSDIQTQINGLEPAIATGTSSQYWRGDKTWQDLDKSAVGLDQVDNTSDTDKPVSAATQSALDGKEDSIATGTINQYWRGDKTWQTLDKSAVGLDQVDNTSDVDKPMVHLTGNETVDGVKTFTGQIVATSTSTGFRPCPVMTDAQMLAVSSPSNGDCVYNSTKKAPYYYSSTDVKWKLAGGGAGGSRLNLLTDGSFEDGVAADGSCATCTASQEDTIVLETVNNEKSLKINFAAQNGCYTVDKTTGSEFANVQSLVSALIKTSISGATFTSRVDGSDTTNVITISSRDAWDYYEIPVVSGATSVGYKICSGSSVTDDIYVDETFVGPSKVTTDIGVIGPWTSYTPTFGSGLGTPTSVSFKWRQVGSSIEVEGSYTGGTVAASLGSISLPNNYTIDTNVLTKGNTSANPGHMVGWITEDAANTTAKIVTANGTNAGVVYHGSLVPTGDNLTPVNSNTVFNGNQHTSVYFKVPIAGLASSVNSYQAPCGANCTNEFGFNATAAGVVSDDTYDFITGNASVSDTSLYTYTVPSGIFKVAPRCDCNSGSAQCTVISTTTTSIVIRTKNESAATKTALAHNVSCNKSGDDEILARTIYGSFKQFGNVAVIKDVQTSGTNGGTCTSGSFAQRTLNTLVDSNGIVTSLSANRFTLPAGKYKVQGYAMGGAVGAHKSKLVKDPAGTPSDLIIGSSSFSPTSVVNNTPSLINGEFTLTESSVIELQSRCTTTTSNTGFGNPSSFGVSEVYSELEITRLD